MYVAIFVVTIIAVIMFHEFGHFVTAKLFGMKCEKFFLGFGPTLWSTRRGETEYGVKAIPAGGFVKIVGMSAYEDTDPADEGRTFHEQPAWQRVIVLVAGPATHFVMAFVLLFFALTFIGTPASSRTIAEVVPNSPAAAAGLRPGDVMVSLAGRPIATYTEAQQFMRDNPGERVLIEIVRDGQRLPLQVLLGTELPTGQPGGFLGVYPTRINERSAPGEALAAVTVGEQSIPAIVWATLDGLGRVFSPDGLGTWFGSVSQPGPRNPNGVLSLVGVGQVVNALGSAGEIFSLFALLAHLNITLGIVNLIPLPPLDGGHLATLAVEESVNGVRRLRGIPGRWRLDPSVLTPLALAVLTFFVVISVVAFYEDITKPASDLFQ